MKENKTILVTGANGQVGKEFRKMAPQFSNYTFLFTDKNELPIENAEVVKNYFSSNEINFCINCAAYTTVDKAETEKEQSFLINATAVANLAAVCLQYKVQLIHLSTDYVFDGTGRLPHKETDETNPINIYGQSKLNGEILALKNNPSVIIIRTSWVYAEFGNNFVKTMLRLMQEKESINVVNDQFGCPTYAGDLVMAIMEIINKEPKTQIPVSDIEFALNIYNYCNEGIISWYDFALAIKELTGSICTVNPIPSSQFATLAKRPQYSVLDTTKIKSHFGISIPAWKVSLKKCLELLG